LDQAISDLELKIEETRSVIKVFGEMPTLEAVEPEMKQLFNNLISNSIKFRKTGCPAEISITINRASKDEKKHHRLGLQKTYYKIEFSDKGIGFESEYAEKIFQIFQRLHGKAEYPGSGIGLAICKKIVENHNGVIYAHSVLEEGSTFTIVLPEKQF
jgi:signal transduction histidine kinase